jgi:MFS family permease
MRASIYDGAYYNTMAGFTLSYTTPFALAMKASTTQIGFLAGFPYLAMFSTQFISPTLVERVGSRKKICVFFSILQALMWLPLLLIPFIFHSHQVWYLIVFYTLVTAFDTIGNAPWNSMMAEIVPGNIRGRYFSFRTTISNLVLFVSSFIAAGILQVYTKNIFIGFAIIFGGAMVFRFFSAYYLSQMVEPPYQAPKTKQPSIFKLSTTLGSTNVGRFILFNSLIQFTSNFASPFFSVYMLRDLKFSYLTYILITATGTLATLAFMPFWGKRIDKFGAIKVLQLASIIMPLGPLMWLFSHNVVYLCGAQVLGGFSWGGYNLVLGIFLYYATPLENRTRYFALSNALMFGGAALGSMLGGIVAPLIPAVMKNSLLTIFLISALARIAVMFIFLPHITEVREVEKISIREMAFSDLKMSNLKRISNNTVQRINKLWNNRRQ